MSHLVLLLSSDTVSKGLPSHSFSRIFTLVRCLFVGLYLYLQSSRLLMSLLTFFI